MNVFDPRGYHLHARQGAAQSGQVRATCSGGLLQLLLLLSKPLLPYLVFRTGGADAPTTECIAASTTGIHV
jgi:hypothetical protein